MIVKVRIIIFVFAKKSNYEFNSVFMLFSLSEVGRLDAPKLGGNYDTGQLFLHKVSKLTYFPICPRRHGDAQGIKIEKSMARFFSFSDSLTLTPKHLFIFPLKITFPQFN